VSARTCAECGATLTKSAECVALLHELLALEARVEGAAGGVPHFLAVATYNLQHPSTFTSAALTGLRGAVGDVLDGRATIAEVRRRAGDGARGAARVKRRNGDLPSEADRVLLAAWPTHWPSTVLDVCRLAPEQYVDHVTRWATDTIRTLNATLGPAFGART
jgi:hypothetical protein